MEKIVAIQLGDVVKRLQERDVDLEWEQELVAYLAKKGYDPVFGARPLKRLIQNEVVNPLANALLRGEIPGQSTVQLTIKDEAIQHSVQVLAK